MSSKSATSAKVFAIGERNPAASREFRALYNGRMSETGPPPLCVTSLFIYPIKACGAVAVAASAVEAMGLRHDRRFMIVHAHGPKAHGEAGRFLTQREYPRLALVQPEIGENAESDGASGTLRLVAPDMPALTVAWGGEASETAPMLPVTVWRDAVWAEDKGDTVAAWLSDFLHVSVRLVRAGREYNRPVAPAYAHPHDTVSFADGFPVLLAREESLADLNRRLGERGAGPVPMARFRPNIVVAGGDSAAYEEDQWGAVRTAQAKFRVAKPCARCAVVTVNQETGEKTGAEPLATLATYRRDPATGGVLFAVNLLPDVSDHSMSFSTVSVGDALTVD